MERRGNISTDEYSSALIRIDSNDIQYDLKGIELSDSRRPHNPVCHPSSKLFSSSSTSFFFFNIDAINRIGEHPMSISSRYCDFPSRTHVPDSLFNALQ
jgi:hypothetical protein